MGVDEDRREKMILGWVGMDFRCFDSLMEKQKRDGYLILFIDMLWGKEEGFLVLHLYVKDTKCPNNTSN